MSFISFFTKKMPQDLFLTIFIKTQRIIDKTTSLTRAKAKIKSLCSTKR